MNYIFVPNAKYHILPCVMLARMLGEKSERAILVADNVASETLEKLSVKCISSTDLQTQESLDGANFVFFHHNNPSVFSFFKKQVEQLLDKPEVDRITVSFFGDGLGNAVWGENFYERCIQSNPGIAIEFGALFAFGFVHASALKRFDRKAIEVVDYYYLVSFFESNSYLRSLFLDISRSLSLDDEVFLIPYRPWCTKKFHGGVYDFGSSHDLSKVYLDIIDWIKRDGNLECKQMLYRGDDRYIDASISVGRELSKRFPVTILGDEYPYFLTLEPLMYFLLKKGFKIRVISLDSTTFQAVPFFVDSLDKCFSVGYIGCPSIAFVKSDSFLSFNARKLRGKVGDFLVRYKSFQSNSIVDDLREVEDTFFIASVIK